MRSWVRMTLTTLLVAVLPVGIVWALWALGVVTSRWVAAPLVVGLALLASAAGAAYWKRRPATGDMLFRDLLLWGWLRRVRAERRLADAVEVLDRADADDEAGKVRLLKRLAAALDAKDPYLDGHSHRVARYSALMVGRLGVSHEEAIRLQTAAAVHDVGKLRIPEEILNKPGRLTSDEAELVHRHADDGAGMVACFGDPRLSAIVRHHHERFDGRGYPAGLAGEAIPLGARIVAVADTFDAITSARPYRPAGTHKQALDVLAAEAGTQLDPVVVRAFLAEYAGRRGVALWALLALPIAKTGRHPVPAGAAAAGLAVIGAVTVLQLGRHDVPHRVPGLSARVATPVPSPPSARGLLAQARDASPSAPGRPRRTATVPRAAASAPPGRGAAVAHASAASPSSPAGRRPAAVGDTPRPPAPGPVGAPPQEARPRPSAPTPGPEPRSRPSPSPSPLSTSPLRPTNAPPPASTPPPKPTPAPASTATPPPVSVPTPPPASTPTSPAPLVSPDQCKGGGWAAYGFRDQGQCVSSLHRP